MLVHKTRPYRGLTVSICPFPAFCLPLYYTWTRLDRGDVFLMYFSESQIDCLWADCFTDLEGERKPFLHVILEQRADETCNTGRQTVTELYTTFRGLDSTTAFLYRGARVD